MTVQRQMAPTSLVPTDLERASERGWDDVQFKTIFALSFPVYLVIATASRLVRAGWKRDRAARSIFADACAGAGTMAQMAFAG